MPRPRAVAVVQVPVRIPSAWRPGIDAACKEIDRPPVYWIDLGCRVVLQDFAGRVRELQAALADYAKTDPPSEVLHLELPLGTVRAVRELAGRNKSGRFVRFAVARGLGLDARQ